MKVAIVFLAIAGLIALLLVPPIIDKPIRESFSYTLFLGVAIELLLCLGVSFCFPQVSWLDRIGGALCIGFFAFGLQAIVAVLAADIEANRGPGATQATGFAYIGVVVSGLFFPMMYAVYCSLLDESAMRKARWTKF